MRCCRIYVLLSTLALSLSLGRPKTSKRPNVVVYMADDLGVGEVNQQSPEWAPYDHDLYSSIKSQLIIHTPGLERLARGGVRMTRSYTSSPVCGPARYALMSGIPTGKSPMRANRIFDDARDFPLNESQPNMARLLKSHGYNTYHVGKWGLGHAKSTGAPWKQGFDHYFGFLTHSEAHRIFPAYLWKYPADTRLGYEKVAYPQNYKASEEKCVCVMNRTCDLDPTTGLYQKSKNCANSSQKFRLKALEYIEDGHAKNRKNNGATPFFLYWATTTPHNGFYNPLTRPKMRLLTSPVSTFGRYASLMNSYRKERIGHMAAITHDLDQDIVALLDKLQALNILDDTIIVFMSDNGPHKQLGKDRRYNPHFFHATMGLRGLKRDVYEGGIRSPTMIHWPAKIAAGTVSSAPHVQYDMLLTIAGLIGINPNDPSLRPFQSIGGVSFHNAIVASSRRSFSREWMHIEICEAMVINPYHGCDYAFFDLRDPRKFFKLVRKSYRTMLFELNSDPKERNDLFYSDSATFYRTWNYFVRGKFRSDYCPLSTIECRLRGRTHTKFPTHKPTQSPTTGRPTQSPVPTTRGPTTSPTLRPTGAPTKFPTRRPTNEPTKRPTRPTKRPTERPTTRPSQAPSRRPSAEPTTRPTNGPSAVPSKQPSAKPTRIPTLAPSQVPTTPFPSVSPTTGIPSTSPSAAPSFAPTFPTPIPTKQPTDGPTAQPSWTPTESPSAYPSSTPTEGPTARPSESPTSPTKRPSESPTGRPTGRPTWRPTRRPTRRRKKKI
mmetsp:Transcript_19327/g.31780  ORF Transcript_19327/g.31780 Transcript_19327/m.31780 type:complete len:774 (-) Transcript_19327:1396-3717(-)